MAGRSGPRAGRGVEGAARSACSRWSALMPRSPHSQRYSASRKKARTRTAWRSRNQRAIAVHSGPPDGGVTLGSARLVAQQVGDLVVRPGAALLALEADGAQRVALPDV